MNFHLAQLVAIARHANAHLKGRKIDRESLDIVCTPCKRIAFAVFGDGQVQRIAKSPRDWFAALEKKGAYEVRLIHQTYDDDHPLPEHIAVAFEGSDEDWAMEVLMPENKSHFWFARWEDGGKPGVSYGLMAMAETQPQAVSDIETASRELKQALENIHRFAQKHACNPFTGHFATALHTLQRGGADALNEACNTAWVFGGMGSWNDMGFSGKDGEEYDRVTRQLHTRINEALIAAASY